MGVPVIQLDTKNIEYLQLQNVYNRYSLLYEGGEAIRNASAQFLWRRPKEMGDVYATRQEHFSYQGIIGSILDWFAAALFSKLPIAEYPKSGFYDEFLQDCNSSGKTLIDFAKDLFLDLMLYRKAYVLIDLPKVGEVKSLGEQKLLGGLNPFLVRFKANQIINWQDDKFGALNWVVVKTEDMQNTFLGKPSLVTRWYYFDRTKYQVFEYVHPFGEPVPANAEARLADEGTHSMAAENECPVHRIQVPKGLWLANRVALQVVEHLNQTNSYGWALFMGNLAMPVLFSDSTEFKKTLSETAFLQFGKDDKVEWFEPTGRTFEQSAKRVGELREEIYRSAYLVAQGRSGSATPAAQSGISKEQDMLPSKDVLNEFGGIMLAGLNDILDDVAEIRGDTAQVYMRDGFQFTEDDMPRLLATTKQALDLNIPSPTLVKELQKQVAGRLLGNSSDDIKDTAAKEIDAYVIPAPLVAPVAGPVTETIAIKEAT